MNGLVPRTKRPSVTCDPWDVVVVPFPSHRPWPGDTELADLRAAGLNTPCLVRLKLFTLDNRLLAKRIGRLGENDRATVLAELDKHLP